MLAAGSSAPTVACSRSGTPPSPARSPSLGIHPSKPISGIAVTPDGGGYWLVGADGGVFAFGNAAFHGSLPASGISLAQPIVGVAVNSSGGGYWLAGQTEHLPIRQRCRTRVSHEPRQSDRRHHDNPRPSRLLARGPRTVTFTTSATPAHSGPRPTRQSPSFPSPPPASHLDLRISKS